ncbi:MAG: hypothetical protein QRY16_16790 [Enterobacterales bacterium endosymbiont of Blomia tropicalis]|uniref:hypothetical protein n=1 Tax=Mixta mediterraneensis TaxID=2758443 RepID=UPI0025A8BEEF|nr:hypothetical protein [Mixta mediterraneensis]MDL4915366.1 hypothetical protein [Mixta mediterraneensis]
MVAKKKQEPKANSIRKFLRTGLKVCLHDGDEKAEYEDYPGNKFVLASATGYRP